MAIELDEVEVHLIERMGLMAQADGMPRIAGRLWGLFVVVGEMLSFSNIAETLKISRGSVSTNARILETLDILERRTIPGARQDYFAMKADPYTALLNYSLKRQREKMDAIRTARKKIKRPAAKRQLHDLELFYEVLVRGFEYSLEELDKINNKNAASGTKARKRAAG